MSIESVIRQTLAMNVTLEQVGGRPNLRICAEANWSLFDEIAEILVVKTGGVWTSQLDGSATRYWDLRVGDALVTLHLETFAGVSIFPSTEAPSCEASDALVNQIENLLREVASAV